MTTNLVTTPDSSLPSASKRPGVLLLVADFHGTLASVRALGRAGIDVTVADWRSIVPARWSKFTRRSLECPDPTTDPLALIEWLLKLGAEEPGLVLLPTTDDLAYLFAKHRQELSRYFVVDSPYLDAVYAVLNKWRLREACEAVGIDAPKTWLPGDDLDPEKLELPLVIKPQTQTLLKWHQKGRVVREKSELKAQYDEFRKDTHYSDALLDCDPNASVPMVQQMVESRGIYGLSGFIDESGELFVVSAARKVLQKPQVMGVGLCFQQAKVAPELAEKLRALCRHVDYWGMFEVEFLEQDGKFLLIDFNPRCYGQMAFDIARGANLPLMAYLHAIGDRKALEAQVLLAQKKLHRGGAHAWADRISLEMFLGLRQLTGNIKGSTVRTWSQWMQARRKDLTDAVIDQEDWVPAVVAALSIFWHHAKHPRSTLRAVREA